MAFKRKAKRKHNMRHSRKGRRTRKIGSASKVGYIIGGGISFPFPPMLRCLMRTVEFGSINVASAGTDGNAQDIFYKLNSTIAVGNAANYPLGTASGFTSNVPSGLTYLLGSNLVGGASAGIYSKCLVTGSSINFQLSTEGANNKATEVIIVPRPTTLPSLALTVTSQSVAEQPFAKSWTIPPIMNTKIPAMKHSIKVAKLNGLSSLGTEDTDYVMLASSGSGVVDPVDVNVWQIRLRNLDGSTTTRVCSFKAEIYHDCIFFDLNMLSSAVPS